ncbi:arachidonate 5-lipoxygenase-like, partial [Scleropages formosus]
KITPELSPGEVSVRLSDGNKNSEEILYKGEDTTINFDAEPTKLIIRLKASIIKRITQSFYCKYVDVTRDGSVFYFPVFQKISTAEMTIEEGSVSFSADTGEKSQPLQYISQHWQEDAFFGRLFLDGCNPIMIERCNEIPQKIPVDKLKAVYPDIEELVKKGEIYIVDYELLNKVMEGVIHGHQQYLAAPIVLLQEKEDDLMPIAIQLKQDPGEDNPVFTPKDKKEAWLLAKIWVRNSDFYVHELVSHLLRTHLLGEVFFFCTYVSLYDRHPILRYTGLGKDAQWTVLQKANKNITYESLCLPDDLERRGLKDLKKFYYRDDGLALWDAIHEFLEAVVNNIYKNFPKEVKTREEAVKYLTMIMFTCSAQHAAVNHGQYDIYAWMPNGPTTMRQPPPKYKDQVTEKYIMNTLPLLDTTLEAMLISRLLSHVPKDFVPLGQYADHVANDPHMREPVKKFRNKLKAIGATIEKRAADQEFPYMYLHPDHMENSIAI